MKTIGEAIKNARSKKRYSLAKVEDETKIKKEFVEAIENEKWEQLPEYPVLVGFVKNLSRFLGLEERSTVALLRRDYPPKKLSINPKPDVSSKFSWSPKLTFFVGIAVVLVAIFGYLAFQYYKFITPPRLSVNEPQQNEVVKVRDFKVFGTTDPDATVRVNNQPALVNDDGSFTVDIAIYEGTNEIVISATSRSGKTTTIHRNIKPEL
ncbi:helix-turn-helix domain-containing protein [Patescibacteria group bacterium]|nr:helix-turn-helix domain-containing protein [Patescibacteria group bacterium]